jgi:hypothetical protein
MTQESPATVGLFLLASNLVAGNHYGPARRRVHIKRGSLQVEQVTAILKRFRDENELRNCRLVPGAVWINPKGVMGRQRATIDFPINRRQVDHQMVDVAFDKPGHCLCIEVGRIRVGPVAPNLGFVVGQRANDDCGGKVGLHVPMLGNGQRQFPFGDDLISVVRLRENTDYEARDKDWEGQFVDGMRLGRNVPQAFRVRSVAVRIELHVAEIHRTALSDRAQESVGPHHLKLHEIDVPRTRTVPVAHRDAQVLIGSAAGFESHSLKFQFHGNKVQRPESSGQKKGGTNGAALFKCCWL